jgi:hypothetical protein
MVQSLVSAPYLVWLMCFIILCQLSVACLPNLADFIQAYLLLSIACSEFRPTNFLHLYPNHYRSFLTNIVDFCHDENNTVVVFNKHFDFSLSGLCISRYLAPGMFDAQFYHMKRSFQGLSIGWQLSIRDSWMNSGIECKVVSLKPWLIANGSTYYC